MRCPRCNTQAKDVFPGGMAHCDCGHKFIANHTQDKQAFRSLGIQAMASAAAPLLMCPHCGTEHSVDEPHCRTCETDFRSVRCSGCLSLYAPWQLDCANCGHRVAPRLPGSCPRCEIALEPLTQPQGAFMCPRCSGTFCPSAVLERLIATAKAGIVIAVAGQGLTPKVKVGYPRCPTCALEMSRIGVAKRSGVIVDVCAAHGVWFDRDELDRALRFVAQSPNVEITATSAKKQPAGALSKNRENTVFEASNQDPFQRLRERSQYYGIAHVLVELLFDVTIE
jgi:Zn-finger nucleic acid-binding protein